ncbi:alpha/beta fold hydrolase [Patescibacteria group bacterium]|nr:alpha/beta fold hydrolase [Patescibacteria group bacterium]
MKISFHRIYTKKGLELCGLLYQPKKKTKTVIVHVHGMGGNFYENKFLDVFAKILVDNNIAFCVFNNSGSEFIKDIFIKTKNKKSFIRIGNSREKFEDCIIDIESYINFLKRNNFKKIHLSGHSLGCSKVAYYLSKNKHKEIKSLILVSPSDMIGLVKSDKEFSYRYKNDILTAKKMIEHGNGNDFMPKMVWNEYPITANSYVSIFSENSKAAIFNFYNSNDNFNVISNIKHPIFMTIGTKDDILFMPLIKMIEILKKKAKLTKRLEIKVVENATHDWRGHEKSLANSIKNWVKSL